MTSSHERFNTVTNPKSNSENFFEFIVIFHCFFFEPDQRIRVSASYFLWINSHKIVFNLG